MFSLQSSFALTADVKSSAVNFLLNSSGLFCVFLFLQVICSPSLLVYIFFQFHFFFNVIVESILQVLSRCCVPLNDPPYFVLDLLLVLSAPALSLPSDSGEPTKACVKHKHKVLRVDQGTRPYSC